MTETNEPALLTSKEAADMHEVHPTTWLRWGTKGLAPQPKLKRERLQLFDAAEVQAFNIWDARKAEAGGAQ